jgi:hypothetical protein
MTILIRKRKIIKTFLRKKNRRKIMRMEKRKKET